MDPVSKGFVVGLVDEADDREKLSDSRTKYAEEDLDGTREDFVGSIS
jgi:hypothetical protein